MISLFPSLASMPSPRQRIRRLLPLLLTLLTLASLACPARAQFSGPAALPSRATNAPTVPTTDPAILYPDGHELELLPGDQISVHLYEATDYTTTVRLSLDGSVDLPLVGVLHLSGLTLHQAERFIEQRLISAGMYRSPQINIQLLDSPNQIITVTGEMHSVIPALGGNKRLYDVLSLAGGLTTTSSHVITINRPGVAEPIIVDLGQDPRRSNLSNIPVYARDTIVISRVSMVYVLGAFKQQGAVPIQNSSPLTLMQATALANGAGYEGKYSDLRIIRTVGLERQVIRVDLGKVYKGQAPDPVLQADDIVFLPDSNMKAAIKGGGIGTALGILSLLIYFSSVSL